MWTTSRSMMCLSIHLAQYMEDAWSGSCGLVLISGFGDDFRPAHSLYTTSLLLHAFLQIPYNGFNRHSTVVSWIPHRQNYTWCVSPISHWTASYDCTSDGRGSTASRSLLSILTLVQLLFRKENIRFKTICHRSSALGYDPNILTGWCYYSHSRLRQQYQVVTVSFQHYERLLSYCCLLSLEKNPLV